MSSQHLPRLLAYVAAAVVAVVAVGCSDPAPAPDRTTPPSPTATVRAAVPTMVEGLLTACVAPTPDVAESVDGGWEGFDVAVLEGVAAELGLDLEVVPSSFDEVVSGVALNGGTCEVAAAAVVDRDPLEAVVRTSAPYRTVHRLVVATEAGAEPVPAAEVTGTVGVEQGGTATDAVDALTAAEVVTYPSRADLARALTEGTVGAVLVSVPARAELESLVGGELALVAAVPTEEETVLLLPLGAEDELVGAVDGALEALRGRGDLAAWRDQWLRG